MGGDCIAAQEADAAWRLALGVAFIVIAIDAIEDAFEEFQEAKDDLVNNAQRQLDISLIMKDLWLENQHAQKLKALNDALAMEVPERTKQEAWGIFSPVSNVITNQALAIRTRLNTQYGICGNIDCDRSIEMSGGIAAANASYAYYRAGLRRTERRRQTKRELLQTAHSSSFADPGPIFNLMQNSASIYQSNLTGAYTHLAGAAALGGVGFGLLNFGGGPGSGTTSQSGGGTASSSTAVS